CDCIQPVCRFILECKKLSRRPKSATTVLEDHSELRINQWSNRNISLHGLRIRSPNQHSGERTSIVWNVNFCAKTFTIARGHPSGTLLISQCDLRNGSAHPNP